MSADVRLRIIEALIPVASRHAISDPEEIVKKAGILENYVLGCEPTDAATPDASNKRTLKLPRKDKIAEAPPGFLPPP